MIRSQSALPYSKKPINEILEKIDSHIFLGRVRAYDAFKLFDKDKDGDYLRNFIHFTININFRLHYKGGFI